VAIIAKEMDHRSDIELLAEFAGSGCERAFAEVVSRHVDLVYSTAFRQVQNASLAEEVTQAVFVLLARKARSLGSKTVVSAWLFRTARFASQDALKGEFRRKRREQQAFELQTANPASGEAWREVAPKLDEALANLSEQDRTAILLRYFENKSFREVGMALSLGEEAARKRVDRAVGKLREKFVSKKIEIPDAVLTGLITAHAIQAAPCGLGLSASTTALSQVPDVSLAVAAVVKGAIQAMLWAKLRKIAPLAAGIVMMVALAALLVPKEETVTENAVLARHLAITGGEAIKVDVAPEKVGTACMSCHRGERGEDGPVIRALVIFGRWKNLKEEIGGEIEIARSTEGQIYERKVIAGGETRMRVGNGKNGWVTAIGGETKGLLERELTQFKAETEFLSLKNEAKEFPAERVTFCGEECFQVSNNLEDRKSYFSVETGLRTGVEWRSNAMDTRESYSDYRKFSEVFLPTRIKRERGGKIELLTITRASIREIPVAAFSPKGIGPPGPQARVPTGH
jgi:RNA polymerase sigma factor (sigma-70 family)